MEEELPILYRRRILRKHAQGDTPAEKRRKLLTKYNRVCKLLVSAPEIKNRAFSGKREVNYSSGKARFPPFIVIVQLVVPGSKADPSLVRQAIQRKQNAVRKLEAETELRDLKTVE